MIKTRAKKQRIKRIIRQKALKGYPNRVLKEAASTEQAISKNKETQADKLPQTNRLSDGSKQI